ncbi:OmpA family protein [Streptomyces sp. C]|uniref:OmpA family protein n=1 Tax=Streptomyces sp. C TaxID=253839 RepID=UPI0001B58712|nr:OmpA family protein [Streptomyces sp. C]EFL12853.1 type VI secretion system OmpA/MotB [Streptomyces sp. C]
MRPGTTARTAAARLAACALTAAVCLTTALGLYDAPAARAEPSPSSPPEPPPVPVDPRAKVLELEKGAQLAPPVVVDILSVSGDLSGDSGREESSDDVKLTLQSEVLFAKDSAELSGAAGARIAEVAQEIRQNSPRKVMVCGFTDNLGTYAHGKTLSTQRAEAVHKALAAQLSASGIAYEVVGKSEDDPIADNSTEEGRKKNRRVEISFGRGPQR